MDLHSTSIRNRLLSYEFDSTFVQVKIKDTVPLFTILL
jgi:hypothetical protein